MSQNSETPSDQGGAHSSGYDEARRALEEARAKPRPAPARQRGFRAGGRGRRRGWTGPGADRWDPQPLGSLVSKLSVSRGWNDRVATGRLFAQWPSIVGADIAAKATPEKLEEGVLHVRAVSTAWATNLRLMSPEILRRIAAAQGPGKVRRLRIEGPAAPDWRKGPLHVSGRGPRDTYG